MNFDTNRISKMIKESSNAVGSRSNINIVESCKVGNRTFGLIKEYGNYVIKYTNKPENVIEEDFKYIKGEQNRHRFMRSNLKEAQNFFNLFVSEQHINPFISEDDDKYVIKKEVENQPEAEPDIDMDVDSADVDVDMEDEIEADLEEYQELTGKLAYILGQVEDDKKNDVTKYVFNSLIAAMPSVGDEVSSSIKQKLESKLEDNKDEELESDQEEDGSSMEESLKKKGFVVKESMSKKEALAFLGAADKSGVFKEKPTRFYDGETKEPLMNKGVHKKGKSTPYEKKSKSINEDESQQISKRKRKRVPFKVSGAILQRVKKLQLDGSHNKVSNIVINEALNVLLKGYTPDEIVNSNEFLGVKLYLKSMSKKLMPISDMLKRAISMLRPIIKSKGFSVINEDDVWIDIEESMFGYDKTYNPKDEDEWKEARDELSFKKKNPEYQDEVKAGEFYHKYGYFPWEKNKQNGDEISIDEMLSDDYLKVNEDEGNTYHNHWDKEISQELKSKIFDLEHYGYDVFDSNYTIEVPSEDSVDYELFFTVKPSKNKTEYEVKNDVESLVGYHNNGPGQPYRFSEIESMEKVGDNKYKIKISGRTGYDI